MDGRRGVGEIAPTNREVLKRLNIRKGCERSDRQRTEADGGKTERSTSGMLCSSVGERNQISVPRIESGNILHTWPGSPLIQHVTTPLSWSNSGANSSRCTLSSPVIHASTPFICIGMASMSSKSTEANLVLDEFRANGILKRKN